MREARLVVEVPGAGAVSALLVAVPDPAALYVLAHGAGAGMAHPFMGAVAQGLAARGISTLRFQFPYMERGSKRPDAPRVATEAVRAAVEEAGRRMPGLVLVAGGKSFGGRMASQAQAAAPLPGVAGLAFLGFPLHPAGRPDDARAAHLAHTQVPLLFLQGTRDALADPPLMRALARRMGPRATLAFLDDADHSFHVPSRSGRTDDEVLAQMLDKLARWMKELPK